MTKRDLAWYTVDTPHATGAVAVNGEGIIVTATTLVRDYEGQALINLQRWPRVVRVTRLQRMPEPSGGDRSGE